MTEENKDLLFGAIVIFVAVAIGLLLGFRIGFYCGERSAFAKYDQAYKDARRDYVEMKNSYLILKKEPARTRIF